MTSGKVRVLVVDDSALVRRVVTDLINADPDLGVAGTAHNGRVALERVEELNPDLVTLDVEMPELGGLDTLVELRRRRPRLPVIMLSSLTERGAEITLECLFRGASDYVTKPHADGGGGTTLDEVGGQLLHKIKVFCGRAHAAEPRRSPAPPRPAPEGKEGESVQIVAIGASTGGPNALTELLSRLPETLPVPVLVVQHMPPLFTRTLAQRLAARTRLTVREAADGEVLKPGTVLVAPGDWHMMAGGWPGNARIRLHQSPPQNSCRPSVDVLLRSVSAVYGGSALAVILTGMGVDGVQGCETIRQAGGQVLVQDEGSSTVWGMPGAVYKAGLARGAMPPDRLGEEIVRCMRAGRRETWR